VGFAHAPGRYHDMLIDIVMNDIRAT